MTDQEPDRVMLGDETSILYWTYRFDVSREELEEAVETVGDSAAAVAAYLNIDLAQRRG